MSRKYKQQGYQDNDDKPQRSFGQQQQAPRSKDLTFGPRPIQMPGTRNVSRCAMCGVILQFLSEPLGQCPKCGAELHSCRQCNYFDPGRRFECAQPIPANIPDKTEKNSCTYFDLRVKLEKETTTAVNASPQSSNDARAAFERLFKK